MLVTKEVLQSMKTAREIVFLKKTDGQYYIICGEIELKEYGVSIKKEFLIETINKYNKLYEIFYTSQSDHIQTIISFLRVNDSIKMRVCERKMYDDLTLIDVFLDVERLSKTAKLSEYTFWIDTTIDTYL